MNIAQKLYKEIEKIVSSCDFLTLKKLTSSASKISGNWTYGVQISAPFCSYGHRDNFRIHRIGRTEKSVIDGVKKYVAGMQEEFAFIKPYLDYFSDEYIIVSSGLKAQGFSTIRILFENKKTGRKYLLSEAKDNKLFSKGYKLSRVGEIKPQEGVKTNHKTEFSIQLKYFEEIPEFEKLKKLMQNESYIDTKDYFVF